jgi:hypothetical protein
MWQSHPALSTALALGFVLTATGCYSYTVTSGRETVVGQSVRARVSGAEAERLESVLGSGGREIEGQLLEQMDSSIVLSVAMPLAATSGVAVQRAHQRIIIPRSELQELQVRQLDRTRTSLAVGAGVAVVATALAASTGVIHIGSGGSRGNPDHDRIPVSVPLIRLYVGRASGLGPR